MCRKAQKERAVKHWYSLGQRRCLCGRQLVYSGVNVKNRATLDHIVPQSNGGTWRLENLMLTCYDCNQDRGNQRLSKWAKKRGFPKLSWVKEKEKSAYKALGKSYVA